VKLLRDRKLLGYSEFGGALFILASRDFDAIASQARKCEALDCSPGP
jgi:hypothetical protein